MKRKLIHNLLTTNQLKEEVLKALPEGLPDKDAVLARKILAIAIRRFIEAGTTDPKTVYAVLCGSMITQLPEVLKGTTQAKVSKRDLARVQTLLASVLTSKAGRPKTNDQSRQKQNAAAQERRRDRLKKEGRIPLNVFLSPKAASYLDAIKQIHNCDNQADAIELVLEAAMKGEVLHRSK